MYYSAVFGWSFTRVKYSLISNPRLHGDLLECSVQTPPMHCITNTFTRSFEVKDFDQITKKILVQDGQIAIEKFVILG